MTQHLPAYALLIALLLAACASQDDGVGSREPDAADGGGTPDGEGDGPDVVDEPALTDSEIRALLSWTPPEQGVAVMEMYADVSTDTFWQSPWPTDLRASGDRPQIAAFPNPDHNDFVARLIEIVRRDVLGFGVSTALYLPMTGPLPTDQLPDVAGSRGNEAPVFVRNVDADSEGYGELAPIEVSFVPAGGRYAGTNQLVAIPYAGAPLRARTRYAFVATTALRDADGLQLQPSALATRLAAVDPNRLGEHPLRHYADALASLASFGTDAQHIAGLSVFTTGDPTQLLRSLVADQWEASPWTSLGAAARTDVFERFCVFERSGRIRNWQHGEPPFETGGDWQLGPDGIPVEADPAPVRVWVTVPRGPAPEGGFRVALFARTGAGGDRPLVDRGVRDADGNATPGSGLANSFATAGVVGIMLDGPHGGQRNPTQGDEQFLMFNIANPVAMRDNVRESALELALVSAHLGELLDGVSACDGDGALVIEDGPVALFGHSMGATIAPLVGGTSPNVGALLLSGAGGSWQQNILHKLLPIPTRPIAEFLLSYPPGALLGSDPVLNLLQWAGEPADPQVYAHLVSRAPPASHPRRHVLMMQGIADTYILPPIANALSLPLGVELLGDPVEAMEPESAAHTPFLEAAAAIGRPGGASPLDTRANLLSSTSALLVQYREDGVEDGHEVVFQLPVAHEHLCTFLASWRTDGAPGITGVPGCRELP